MHSLEHGLTLLFLSLVYQVSVVLSCRIILQPVEDKQDSYCVIYIITKLLYNVCMATTWFMLMIGHLIPFGLKWIILYCCFSFPFWESTVTSSIGASDAYIISLRFLHVYFNLQWIGFWYSQVVINFFFWTVITILHSKYTWDRKAISVFALSMFTQSVCCADMQLLTDFHY